MLVDFSLTGTSQMLKKTVEGSFINYMYLFYKAKPAGGLSPFSPISGLLLMLRFDWFSFY